ASGFSKYHTINNIHCSKYYIQSIKLDFSRISNFNR
ncbi:hypothetical protein AVEN_184938-1, partial [Araneus ventricosus]